MSSLYVLRRGFLALICGMSSVVLSAQKIAVKGKVIHSRTRKALSGVQIQVEGSKFTTTTNAVGEFSFNLLPPGEQVLVFRLPNFKTAKFPIKVEEGKTKSLDFNKLEPNYLQAQQQTAVIALSDAELDQEEGSFDNVSGLLQATKDVFLNAAAFDFSSTFFRPRGLNSDHGKLLINGIEMNKFYNGRPQWSVWGGLNDVQRNQVFSMGMAASDVSFGGLAGTTNIIMRASEYSSGGKFSIAASNRSYSGRLMGSYSSGLMASGWAYTISVSRRFAEHSFRDGSVYDANAFFLAVEKKFNERHSLNFSGFFTPNRRGKTAANSQEVYDLNGIRYNSYWGYQNGKVRNSRIRRIEEPVFMLNHSWEIDENIQLNTNLAYQSGKMGNSRLEYGGSQLVQIPGEPDIFVGGGTNPDPAYYQKLPSYFLRFEDKLNYQEAYLAQREFLENGQLNWSSLYAANLASAEAGGNSIYVLYEDRNDDTQVWANSILRAKLTSHIDFQAKMSYRNLKSKNFAQILDLLGGQSFLDVDSFSERSEAQNTLLTPIIW